MIALQIISIILLSIFMSLVVFAWLTTLDARKDIDQKMAGYIVDANRDYILRFDMIQDHHKEIHKSNRNIEERMEHLISYKVKTFRDFETGLLNYHALRVYKERYRDQDVLHFTIINVKGIIEADKNIEEILKIESYAASRVGIELYKVSCCEEKLCDIYRLEPELFLMITTETITLELMTKVRKNLLKYNEVEKIYMGVSHRITKRKPIDKCIMEARSELQRNSMKV